MATNESFLPRDATSALGIGDLLTISREAQGVPADIMEARAKMVADGSDLHYRVPEAGQETSGDIPRPAEIVTNLEAGGEAALTDPGIVMGSVPYIAQGQTLPTTGRF